VPVTVWTWIPRAFTPDSPILVVLHGAKRNGDAYRDAWAPLAERYGAMLAAPEFDSRGFPTPRQYEVGNMRDRDRRPLPPEEWTYAIIDGVFTQLAAMTDSRRRGYRLFGHSAGAQLVHRMLTFSPESPVERAVAANAGCYTLPTADERFPYGLGDMARHADLDRLLATPLTILLGEDDRDPEAAMLLKSPEAMRQGAHRLARGLTYFAAGERLAAERGVTFAWRLVTIPGVGHSNKKLAPHAAAALLG
jgi:poly(3-hydroxybutyrate) depolymerase